MAVEASSEVAQHLLCISSKILKPPAASITCMQGPWLTRYYLGLRKRPSVHRTLGARANAAVDLNTPVLQFRDQVPPALSHSMDARLHSSRCCPSRPQILELLYTVCRLSFVHANLRGRHACSGQCEHALAERDVACLLSCDQSCGVQVLQYDDHQPGMDVTVRHLRPDALPDCVFPKCAHHGEGCMSSGAEVALCGRDQQPMQQLVVSMLLCPC